MRIYKSIFGALVALILLVFMFTTPMLANADIGNTATQQICTQLGTDTSPIPPTFNTTWGNGGLNRSLDRQVYGVDVVAYKIKWSTGWGDWVVKGVNDLYSFTTNSTNPADVDARITWIYFYDHPFQVIYCS